MNFGSPLLQAFAIASRRQAMPAVSEPVQNDQDATPSAAPNGSTNSEASTVHPIVPTNPGKRKLQCVNTKQTKVRVLKWMMEQVELRGTETNISSMTVRNFPDVFRADSVTANLMKVGRWWAEKESMFEDYERDQMSFSHTYAGWRKRVACKARCGRGRKTGAWNIWLYPLVRTEFERLRKAGVKFSPDVLLQMARNVLLTSSHPTFGPSTILPTTGKTFMDTLTSRWVQQFQEVQGIVVRAQAGKLQVSDEKTVFVERATAYHMGVVRRAFDSGELNEDLIENMDETHFVVNMDNGRTLGFRGDKEVKYADVVSGGIGLTMTVKITGGRAARICTPLMIFQNNVGSYPIRGTPDNIAGVCYRTSPSSFMTSELLAEYYSESRVSWADPSGRSKVQFIDNYPGHNVIPSCSAALDRIKTQLRYFPANSTHLTQPCDSFVISKIKDAWRRRWDAKKMEMIAGHMWQGDGRDGTSGALKNPGWSYFLQLAADSVRDVNAQTDQRYGLNYARKAMIRCGLSLNLDGVWDVKQLTPELQQIIAKYPSNFAGSTEGCEPAVRPPRKSPGTGRGRAAGRGAARRGGAGRGAAGRSAGWGRAAGRSPGQGRGGDESVPNAQFFGESSAAGSGRGGSVATTAVDGATSAAGTARGTTTVASTWAATRPGARAHRKAARRSASAHPQSNFHSQVQPTVATADVGGTSGDADAGCSIQQVQSSVLLDSQTPSSIDADAAAEEGVDDELWGFLETQYD